MILLCIWEIARDSNNRNKGRGILGGLKTRETPKLKINVASINCLQHKSMWSDDCA